MQHQEVAAPAPLVANQNRLLDHLIKTHQLKNDAELARKLDVMPPVISKIRHHRLPVGATLIIRMMDEFDISLREIRELLLPTVVVEA
ncbi:hypothetical protein ACLB1G_21805 [Oxalobacteraceae bacterium A2-2]